MKMRVLWLFFVLLIVVNCDDNDNDDNVDDSDNNNNEVSTDLPSIYYTEPSSSGDNDAKGFTEIPGGHIVRNKRVLEKSKSPYLLREDLFIEREGKLVVESGVEIRFAPMIGITVRGILTAKGEPEAPIILTSSKEPSPSSSSQSETRLIRLVDGPSTLEGRLQIFHRGSWRSVCTNSRNWTRATYETACRELGYQGGRWSGWIDKLWPSKPRLLYEDPQCHGTESSLQDCLQWSNRQLGSGVCDYHPDISISCTQKHDGSSKNTKNWRGIKFENAIYEKPLIQENTFYIKRSKSIMRHITLKYAGSGRDYNVTSALHVEGVPPQIDSLIILNSAYNGINITTPDSPIIINNCTIKNNNGYGIFMNSSTGLAHINNCEIINNYGDGIKYIHYDERPDDKLDRNNIYDLCTFPSTTSQTFPITISMEQSKYSQNDKICSQRIFTRYGHVLTLQFLQMKTDRNDSGSIMIYDGLSEHDKLIANVNIRNNTLPQSITTTKQELYIQFIAQSKTKIINFIRISSGYKKKYDLNITNSIIEGNNGRGIGVENLRSLLHVHGTSVSANNHIAGIHVLNGAADINITSSRISYNNAAGINITMTGGNRNISKSIISSNQGYGLSLWLNDSLSSEYLSFNQTTVVEYSNIFNNNDIGVLIGNSTGLSYVNITGNNFYDCRDIAIKIQTSWINDNKTTTLKLQIGNNIFINNSKVGIDISPALNIIGKIEYNQFRKHKFGVIHIKNSLLYEEFNVLPANILIQYNDFFINSGIYVVSLGLSTYSDLQYLLFTRNFIKDNNISEPFDLYNYHKKLIPRSRVSAVIVVSSSNVVIFRNIISNPDSNYEIGSHLEDQSKIINCTLNWLGSSDENKILDKLFYRKDRYNLAKIDYLPYLLHDNNPASNIKRDDQYYVQQFIKTGTNLIGGEIDGQLTLYNGEYIVERDINIRPGGKLILEAGVTLKFPPAVGMMVAGTLTAHGTDTNQILLTLKEETKIKSTKNNSTKNIFDNSNNNIPIRLLGGNKTNYEGRLQVKIGEKWGTVCNYGWTINNAALVCHQLGLVLDPDDWNFERSDIPDAGKNEDIIISNVRCTDDDIDITKCKLEFFDEFENSCSHDNDVGVRCLEAAWAGLRLGPLATRTDLKYITIEKSGLLDYTTNAFKPALQIDFSRHSLENLNIINNLQDGIGIIYSDIYSGDAINTIDNCDLSYNRGSGISFKQLGLKILNSKIENNKISGIRHNPALSAVKQREFAGWFMQSTSASVDITYKPTIIPDDFINNNLNNIIKLDSSSIIYLVTSKINKNNNNIKINIEIECSPERIIGIQLLNPIENRSTESIIIHDSKRINSNGNIWNLKRDLSVFPVSSSSYTLIIEYESGDNAIGGAVLVLTTIEAIQQNIKNRIKQGPIPTLTLINTIIKRNKNGIYASYYNRNFDEIGNHFLRKSNESIRFINCDISNNENEAIKILSPYWNIYQSNISEISIHINRTLITDNGRGIYQFSHDMRQSNNLFHWIIQDSTIERNKDGGFNVALPYVWQYNENFTHSLYFDNNTWRDNYNFGIIIDGHYATLNMSNNKFNDNKCKHGLISIRGMEKKMKIHNNHIENNNGTFMIEFKIDSQSEIIGEIPAIFNKNYVSKNYDGLITNKYYQNTDNRNHQQMFNIQTCVVCFRGIQKVIIKRNIFGDNALNYELLAGIKTAKINNNVNVEENWWGTSNDNEIKKRIFDFDDWNNHAIANYRPYLNNNEFTADLITTKWDITTSIDMDNLGGRIINNLLIQYRDKPYIINSDITIMPEATVIIEPGVKMEFASNVGILVLGTLKAIGERDNEIIMRPIVKSKNTNDDDDNNDVTKSSLSSNNDVPTIRLCKEGKCNSTTNEGFIEYFNKTTLQWIPICDSRFSERNAQVACRQLGYNSLNVFVSHDKRYELHPGSLTRIWSWPEPLQCSGNEENLDNCQIRLNGQLYGKKLNCPWDGKWVFINCGNDYNNKNNNYNYWGGIRIANSEFEHHFYEHRMHDLITHETIRRVESILKYINIEGAGILHNEKSPAIQTVMKNPEILFVNINNSAYHGINIISPTHTLQLRFNKINNAYGNGINLLSLTGEGREADESSFTPLKNINIPYNLFSMVDICDTSKEIEIEERILLYYKYDNNPVNCIKIFRSTYRAKPIGFRLLQFNIFNSTGKPGRADEITLYDGDIYNITAKKIGQLKFNSKDEKKLFKTDGPSLSVKLFANGASGIYGFIAEIVTLPISAIGFNRDVQHNISNSIISNCQDGAIKYSNAGEVNAIVTIEKNQIIYNCKKYYGNFTTCKETISMNIQNTQSLYFRNNLIRYNQGGLSIISDSRGSATSLKGWIYNNLFSDNYNAPVLSIEGRKSSPYQEITIFRNYFMKNNAPYDNNIILKQVVSNMTLNYLRANLGLHLLEVSGFERVRLPIYQTTSHNGFYNNYAVDPFGRSTIVAGTPGQQYVDNIFFNPDNDYEIMTVNRSLHLEMWRSHVDAKHNWWSYNETLAVAGRIRDREDSLELLQVDYIPYHMNNKTVLNDKCPPGWDLVGDTCYIYIGAPMDFFSARKFCQEANASMPFIVPSTVPFTTGKYSALWEFLLKQQERFSYSDLVWIQDLDRINQCTTFTYQHIEIDNCDRPSPFICEIDPGIRINPLSWKADVVALGVFSACTIAIALLAIAICFWISKSKRRKVERLERRNSIRQSLHSLRSIGSTTGFTELSYRRKPLATKSTDTLASRSMDYKKMMNNGSIDSMDKSQLNSSIEDNRSYDVYESHNPQYSPSTSDFKTATSSSSTATKQTNQKYQVPHADNPVFDLAYRNEGFRNHSTFTSRNNSNWASMANSEVAHDDTPTDQINESTYLNTNTSTLPLNSSIAMTDSISELKRDIDNAPYSYEQYGPPPITPGSEPVPEYFIPPSPPQPYYYDERPRSGTLLETNLDCNEDKPLRSKSEALLETNFDVYFPNETTELTQLSANSRSKSQPLETAM
ncbi:hypothetical protein HCN44_005075 [Aphidius gifuensis]|uniref:SRCR domain-containing protein n=1 Tax=Aphidius gifuensis TaxID=684658 RepID=A0A834XXQ5_APHGI|nr:protein bark beetle isoform X2 [Aphidius gifuensis]KAF7992731.1 hypothetical protein HCN44_005075 [Aphidius gifuensis]